MAAMSDYLENKVLDMLLGNNAALGTGDLNIDNVHVALFTAGPSDAGGGTELSGNAYARIAVTNDSNTNWAAAVGGLKKNSTAISFPQADGDWGTITHVGLFDKSSGGNLLFHGALNTPKTVADDDTFSFGIGDLQITLS